MRSAFPISLLVVCCTLTGCLCVSNNRVAGSDCGAGVSNGRTVGPGLSNLNGTMTVEAADGRYGLADTLGNIILEPTYDEIYFVTNDICVARNGALYNLIHRNGARLAQAEFSAEPSDEELVALCHDTKHVDECSWERVLSAYESLAQECSQSTPSVAAADSLAADVRTALQLATGTMSDHQVARFKTIRAEVESWRNTR